MPCCLSQAVEGLLQLNYQAIALRIMPWQSRRHSHVQVLMHVRVQVRLPDVHGAQLMIIPACEDEDESHRAELDDRAEDARAKVARFLLLSIASATKRAFHLEMAPLIVRLIA